MERAAIRVIPDIMTLTPEQMLTFRWSRPDEELQDLSDDQACQDVLQDLRSRTEQWQKETEDVPPAKKKPNRYDYETGEQLQS